MKWRVFLYTDIDKKDLFKILNFERLEDIAYCLDKKIYEITNFYHKIKKPSGIFNFINLYKL